MSATTTQYAIAFTEDDGTTFFAGRFKDGLGYAPRLETALKFDDEETAERTLENGYGPAMREIGVVVEVAA